MLCVPRGRAQQCRCRIVQQTGTAPHFDDVMCESIPTGVIG
jgi:hypothetical protein